MLITRSRRAWNLPVLLFVLGAAFLAGSAAAGMIAGMLLGAGALAMALAEFRALMAVDDRVVVRGVRRRLALERAAVAFGVRLQTSWRSVRYIVFITDGSVSDEIAEFLTEDKARRAIGRLEGALGTKPGRRAAAFVRSIEKPWKTNVAEGKKVIDAYYASPAWRRAKYGVTALVIVYVIAMLVYGVMRSTPRM